MSENKTFCEECRNYVDYVTYETEMIGTIRGIEYHYIGKEAKCACCGSFVGVEEIIDSNLKALYFEYRQKNGIISLEKINSIPKRYKIGKRPLSILLGWGEHTFSRFTEGDIPTRQYSDVLNRIFDDPSFFLNLLENNKERLNSQLAYQKCHKAVVSLINEESSNFRKIDSVVAYLLNQCEDITPLALQKSLYYVQGFFFAFFGKFIFEDDCEAWAHGPVYRDIYARYSDYHFDPISKVESFDSSIFTVQEKSVLDCVIKYFCCYSGKILEQFTHNESPWQNTRGDLIEGASSFKIIDRKIIADYFVSIKNRYKMNSPKDIHLYSMDMFSNI